jgi:GTP-binding protein LepA
MDQSKIRNFVITAHIDHGKSTLSDRFLELTGTVQKRDMKAQILDNMELERERGITIKLAPARMSWKGHELNLIDTPGHVDFTYEVSRSLSSVEGAILLVDATQGVQAQTIANLYLALEQDLKIIAVVNKIDLPAAQPEETRDELVKLLGCAPDEVLFASGKSGEGAGAVLDAVVDRVPPPKGDLSAPLRALIFDSFYDDYKGVVAYVRVIDGSLKNGSKVRFMATGLVADALEVGVMQPRMKETGSLTAGEIGYLVTGQKDISGCRVGDTVTLAEAKAEALPGYREVKPMVFAGIFAKEGSGYERLREAMLKLKLSDSSLMFEPERSTALGFGFRVGLLGLLHLEIVQERLRREYNLDLIVTAPSVAYRVEKTDGREIVVKSPQDLPDATHLEGVKEPWVKLAVICREEDIGGVLGLIADKRGIYKNTEFLGEGQKRVIVSAELPLSAIVIDFYDKLKSVSSGYASMSYEFSDYRPADVVRMNILVAEEPVEALSTLVYRDEAQRAGRKIAETLKEAIPRQMFEVKIQAAVGGKIVAAERIPAMRKDMLAKMSGGDVTRKMKLLKKQKEGKKRMKAAGHVDLPPETYLAVLKR